MTEAHYTDEPYSLCLRAYELAGFEAGLKAGDSLTFQLSSVLHEVETGYVNMLDHFPWLSNVVDKKLSVAQQPDPQNPGCTFSFASIDAGPHGKFLFLIQGCNVQFPWEFNQEIGFRFEKKPHVIHITHIMPKYCVVCGKDAVNSCGPCKDIPSRPRVYYCGRECQVAHWVHHKAVCAKTNPL